MQVLHPLHFSGWVFKYLGMIELPTSCYYFGIIIPSSMILTKSNFRPAPYCDIMEAAKMNITLNNRSTTFEAESLTISELFKRMKYNFPMIIVKINGNLIKKEQYDDTVIRDGDKVEAIHLISGG